MTETIIALMLLFVGIIFEESMLVLASSFYAIAVNMGDIARAMENGNHSLSRTRRNNENIS